jgi:cellulose synthase/poly-beta-1,6-N-acetylglucosamine synthase-like glycosyltransferase
MKKPSEVDKDPTLLKHWGLIETPLVSDRECQRVDIIVLKYKSPDIECRCVNNLIRHTNWPHKLTWYDARNQTANFSKIWNRLIFESVCDYICIMDSDAYVSPNWLSTMMESFNPDFYCKSALFSEELVCVDSVGVVVPVTNRGGGHPIQWTEYPNLNPFLVYEEQVSGFFFLFKKSILEDVGYFDERFYIFGQDSDWIDRVHASNWNVVVRPDVYIAHDVSASVNKAKVEGEFEPIAEGRMTQLIYKTINKEKAAGVYEVPRYSE